MLRAFLAALCLFALAACGDRAKLARLPENAVVLAFGDSLTFGTGAAEAESYPAQLETLIGRRVVRAMVQLAKSRGVDVLLIGTPEPALLPSAPAFYDAVAKDLSIPYEGGVITDVLKDTSLKSDPIHPNARGYRVIAERVAERLKKAGAI